MVRISAKLESNARQVAVNQIKAVLAEVAKSNATKKELLIAARMLKLGAAMGMDLNDSETLAQVAIVEGANKHNTNFSIEL